MPPNTTNTLVTLAKRLARLLRDGWLVLGVTFALLLVLELGYRAQGAIRSSARSGLLEMPPGSPLSASPWGADYLREHDSTFNLRWEPYVYFRRQPFTGRFITVDSQGYRVTPQAAADPDAVRVYFFGGSTMWGSFLRDAFTIPAIIAGSLNEGTDTKVAVSNRGEAGYVFMQEAIALALALRAGERPGVVVFYDGINDVASVAQQGTAGIPQNEFHRAEEFAWGRALNPPSPSAATDLRLLGRLALTAAGRMDLIRRLRGQASPVAATIAPDSVAKAAMHAYAEGVRIVEGLARQYGFQAVYVWQPTFHPGAKIATAFEEELLARMHQDRRHALTMGAHTLIGPMLDSAMAVVAPGRFVNLGRLFEGSAEPAFVDATGHNTERVIPTIAAAMMPAIEAAVRAAGEARSAP